MKDPVAYAIPFFILAIVLEYWYAKRHQCQQALFNSKDTFTSLAMGTISLPAGVLIGLYTVYAYGWAMDNQLYPIDIQPFWLMVLITLVFQDFCYYWSHRAGHRIRIVWASHINHHSSEYYNLSTALRQTWTGFFSFLFYLPLVYIGFPIEVVGFAGGLNLIYQFWIHTQTIDKMPTWFEAVFNTPSHHRVHHGTNPQYIDKNYAGIFIIWDKFFGTFEPEQEKVKYGLTTNINTYNLLKVAFHEWVAIVKDIWRRPGLKTKLLVPLRPPEWKYNAPQQQHDSEHK